MRENKKALGERFKALRKSVGYSQERLAECLGIDSNSISRIECGVHYPSLETLEKAALTLNVEMRDFFLFSEEVSVAEMRRLIEDFAHKADETSLREIYAVIQEHLAKQA